MSVQLYNKEIENREWWIKLIKNVHHEILNKDKNNIFKITEQLLQQSFHEKICY